jgi:hypothetical protein
MSERAVKLIEAIHLLKNLSNLADNVARSRSAAELVLKRFPEFVRVLPEFEKKREEIEWIHTRLTDIGLDISDLIKQTVLFIEELKKVRK